VKSSEKFEIFKILQTSRAGNASIFLILVLYLQFFINGRYMNAIKKKRNYHERKP